MLKIVVGVAAGIALLLSAASASAAAGPAISVVGSANVTYPDFPVQGETTVERAIVTARILPSGEISGSIISLSPFGFTKADVTCIEVVGDTIYVGGTLEPRFDVYLDRTFAQIAFGIRDGEPDLVASAIFGRADVDTCEFLSAFPPVFVADQGEFVVTGA